MTEIKILIYTDVAKIAAKEERELWGVTRLRKILETKTSNFVEFRLSVVNRHEGARIGQASTHTKVDEGLLKDFDQVWFFGFYQNNADATFGDFGSDKNELGKDEVDALSVRMDKHRLGVLISGDHSNPRPTGKEDDPVSTFMCLGKAIGSYVPRAKDLRTWDGPPTVKDDETSIDTTAEARPMIGTLAEMDRTPQRLALYNFAAGTAGYLPHRLFWGMDENGQHKTIDVLPDHPHEGAVVIPESLGPDWPPTDEPDGKKKRPMPVIVALGFDRRVNVNRAIPVLAAYDGDSHNVGRIVADSSWHHFLNMNLDGLSKAPGPGSEFDLIGQFYRNLAHYLAPLEKRQQIAKEMREWVVTHPGVLEERGSDRIRWGQAARLYLSRVATPFEIAEMLHVETPADLRVTDSHVEFTTLDSGEMNLLPTQEEVLGSIVRRHYSVASERLKAELEGAQLSDSNAQPLSEEEVVEQGFREAFDYHRDRLEKLAAASKDLSDRLKEADKKEVINMTNKVCQGTDTWLNSRLRPGKPNEEPEGHFVIKKKADGTFEGTHEDQNGKKSEMTEVKCGGENGTLSFKREDEKNKYTYTGTIKKLATGGFEIVNGSRDKTGKPAPSDGQKEERYESQATDDLTNAGDDWSAEKPGN